MASLGGQKENPMDEDLVRL
ncbi:hypothetical protein CCACVL1_16367 [Corchorus capsularis]|uniref:Uncharacterized protein n=1 Tax=Corchorus capsularis TaxID=210143 RepID=A0A1R3HXB1_COCAP|nr:hypothetical protein CCACVL1_16367 [Corchorus capsularis]